MLGSSIQNVNDVRAIMCCFFKKEQFIVQEIFRLEEDKPHKTNYIGFEKKKTQFPGVECQ